MITGYKSPMDPEISAGFEEVQVEALQGFVRIDFSKPGEIVGFNIPIDSAKSVALALSWCALEAERMDAELTNHQT